MALNRLSKLNKVHRTAVKQQVKGLQQAWRSLRPLEQQQEQQLQEVQEQHATHVQEVNAVLTHLVQQLHKVGWNKHVYQNIAKHNNQTHLFG